MVGGNEVGVVGRVARRSRVGLLAALLAASILCLGSGAVWAGRYVAKPAVAPSGQTMSAKAYFAAGGTLPALSMMVSSGQISTICVSCALPFDLSQLPLTVESAPLIQVAPQGLVEVRDGYVFVQAPGIAQETSVVLQYSVVVGAGAQSGNLAVTILPNPENLGPLRAYLVDGTNEDIVLDGLALVRNASNLTNFSLAGANLTELSRVNPLNGTLNRRADGDYEYSPFKDFYGTDSFTISLQATYSEYQQTLEFHYAIQVNPVNDPPVATNAAVTGVAGSVLEIDLAPHASDVEGGPITFSLAPDTDPRVTLNGSKLTYASVLDVAVSKSVTFVATDNAGATAHAMATFTADLPPNSPPTANNVTVAGLAGTVLEAELASYASDPDANDVLVFTLVPGADNGLVTMAGSKMHYASVANQAVTKDVAFVVTDKRGATAQAKVTFSAMFTANSSPTATDVEVRGAAGAVLEVDLSAHAADTDAGDGLTYSLAEGTDMGGLTLAGSKLSFASPANSGTAKVVAFRVTDRAHATAQARVTFRPKRAPTVAQASVDVSTEAEVDGVLHIDLAANIVDPDKDALIVNITAPPVHGSAIVSGSTVTYRRGTDFVGTDEFTYQVSDGVSPAVSGKVLIRARALVGPAAIGTPIVKLERVAGSETQSLKLHSTATLSFRVLDASGVPAIGWRVVWTAPPDKEDGGFFLSAQDSITNEIGVATATANVGSKPGTYDVKATVTEPSATGSNVAGATHDLTFTIVTGLASALTPGTTEYSVGQVVDSICPKLNELTTRTEAQETLRQRCTELMNSTNGAEVANALRAMAPEEVVNQGRMGNGVAMQQLGNVSARLNALRRGATGVALSGLAFRLDGKILPGEALASLLPSELRGGGASADAGISRWSAFVSGVIGGGEQNQTSQEEGFKFKTKGLTGGVDYRWSPQLVFGAAGGYANTGLDLGGAGGGLDAQGFNLALYGTYYRSEKYYFDTVFNLSHNGYDMDRVVEYTIGSTKYHQVAKGDPDSSVYALSVGGGYEVASLNGYTFEANGRMQYLRSTISDYQETGAGAYNLAIEKQNMNLTTVSFGGLFTKAFSFKWGVLVPQVRLTWDHEFSGDAATIKGSFVNGPGAGFNPTFSFKTDQVDRDYFRLGAGSTLVRPGGATAFLQYETTRGKAGYSDYNVAFGGRWEF